MYGGKSNICNKVIYVRKKRKPKKIVPFYHEIKLKKQTIVPFFTEIS